MAISRRALLAAPALLLSGTGNAHRLPEVDVLLVLAIDASGSVNHSEWALNMRGYAAALVHPDVLTAIKSGLTGSIGLCAARWGHPSHQEVILPWTVIEGAESAHAASETLAHVPRRGLGNTSISSALTFCAREIEQAPFKGLRRVIDVSGDGYDNSSRHSMPSDYVWDQTYNTTRESMDLVDTTILHTIRDEVVGKGIVINGLPILTDMSWLHEYYTESVIGGRGSFMIPAKDFESFAVAIRRKLILEIADLGDRAGAA